MCVSHGRKESFPFLSGCVLCLCQSLFWLHISIYRSPLAKMCWEHFHLWFDGLFYGDIKLREREKGISEFQDFFPTIEKKQFDVKTECSQWQFYVRDVMSFVRIESSVFKEGSYPYPDCCPWAVYNWILIEHLEEQVLKKNDISCVSWNRSCSTNIVKGSSINAVTRFRAIFKPLPIRSRIRLQRPK